MFDYKSLKFTTPLALLIFIVFAVIAVKYVDLFLNSRSLIKVSKEKSLELSHKIGQDIEVLLRFTKNPHDINDILINYLVADVNYIAVYQDGNKLYKSYFNKLLPDRETFIQNNSPKVLQENHVMMILNEEHNMLQTLVRYTLPKKPDQVVSGNFGVIYFEYSMERDRSMLFERSRQNFFINLAWGILLLGLIYSFILFKFIRPITQLSGLTKKLAQGDYNSTELSYKQRFKDEIYTLFASFDQMASNIQTKNNDLKKVNHDLIEQTKNAHKANQSKSDFLANMSHEIRTPLNAITGFIQILQKQETDSQKRHYLSIIDSSSKSLLNIINDILDLSKIENGKLDIVMEDFDIRDSINNIIELYRVRADEKHINFIIELDNHLPQKVTSDELRIKQIISNLLSNAIKFTPQLGYVSIKVDYAFDKQVLMIEVRDSGIGISKDKQSSVFDAFTQSEKSTTKEYGGTGLGLTITKKLLNIMGGSIHLESELDKGCRFIISIPAPLVADDKDTSQEETEPSYYFNQEKVLLVEDNKTNQLFATLVLDELNLSYMIANNGQEAVEAFKKHDFSLILMDENMPIMNGSEASAQIRKIEQKRESKRIPIIALTANALKGDQERFLAAGMDDYVSKPIDTLLLSQTIHKYLN